jgi:hypothetical protein
MSAGAHARNARVRSTAGSMERWAAVSPPLVTEALVPGLDDHLQAVATLADQEDEEAAAQAPVEVPRL